MTVSLFTFLFVERKSVRVMLRQKTQEEIDQERKDEEFARQLQHQMDEGAHLPARAHESSHNSSALRQVLCPSCHSTNNIPAGVLGNQAFRCGSCSYILPSGAAARGVSVITCQNCRCHNEIPVGATSQFMCGRCYRVLSFNQVQGPQTPQIQVQQQSVSPSDAAVYEGRVTKTIQVRCGQCQIINTVKVSRGTVEFICSSCQATNEVDA